jgi:hypothetical protein
MNFAKAISGMATTVVASVFALAPAMAFVHVYPSLLMFTMTLQIQPDGLPAVAMASTNVTRVRLTSMYLLPVGQSAFPYAFPHTAVHPHGLPLYVESSEYEEPTHGCCWACTALTENWEPGRL